MPKTKRQTEIKRSSIIGMTSNLFLFVFKIIVYFLSHSVSILSDAFNNLSDLVTSLLTFIAYLFSEKPADDTHPYGHGRAEYIATQMVSFFIILMGVILFWESFKQIINPEPVELSIWVYLVLMMSIIVKWGMMMSNIRIVKKTQSELIQAVVVDSKFDVIYSCVLLISMLIMPYTPLPIDGVVGLLVSVLIFSQGVSFLRKSMSKLLGKEISPKTISLIDEVVHENPLVLGYHNLKSHDYGPQHIHVSIDIELPDTMDLIRAHEIVDKIEKELYHRCQIDAVAHIDPISTDEHLNTEMRQVVLSLSQGCLTSDDILKFSCVKGHFRTSIFLRLKCANEKRCDEIKDKLVTSSKNSGHNLSFHVEYDYGETNES